MNLGFLGGRFDPVHCGHLGAAEDALVLHPLDRVIFVPTSQVPHQGRRLHAAAEDRLAMLRLAIAAQPRFAISELEVNRDGASYTLDTVCRLRRLHPADRLFWIIGGDQLARIHEWKGIAELVRLVEFIVLRRPGHPPQPAADIPGLQLHGCAGRQSETSATAVRDCVRRGLPLNGLVPDAVADYIARRGLYR